LVWYFVLTCDLYREGDCVRSQVILYSQRIETTVTLLRIKDLERGVRQRILKGKTSAMFKLLVILGPDDFWKRLADDRDLQLNGLATVEDDTFLDSWWQGDSWLCCKRIDLSITFR
jgi:hypothetical protein